MQTAKPTEAALLPLLLAWASHKVVQVARSLKPRHGAEEVAALVAGGGNPAGA